MSSHSHYLHAAQRAWIKQLSRRWYWRLELPTWGLIAVIYGGWGCGTLFWHAIGPWLGTPLLLLLTCWYMSLQHELIHGHPTRHAGFNQLFGLAPLAVFYPYGLYRDSHIQHHRNDHLTTPHEDPETYYFSPEQWQRYPRLLPLLARVRNTFSGRVLMGPWLDIALTLRSAVSALFAVNLRAIGMWLVHGILLLVMFYWLRQQGISALWYVLTIALPALSLTKVRSFYEHRAEEAPETRSVINEAAWPWRLLFLNLNYHLVHHDLPGLPWYGLPQVYHAERQAYHKRSGGYVVQGYGVWLRQYAVKPIDVTVHPLSPAAPGTELQGAECRSPFPCTASIETP
ncbi:Fatty acid desaturase [Paramixta manurensis]|uniref:Fatty acid desaturase n=1 Tax=Paramixta manurensis TaxID=2740817 RepID=A0A6M8U8W5_9GAMM|nr:Fatty acid desaturase [Erwiniaceae bacterium PD-1]